MRAQLWLHRLLMVFLLVIGITSSALAREASRVRDVPRDFPGWAALRADEASLAETAMGAPAGQFYHAADFCLGAMFDAGMSQGSVGGLPLHTMAYCPPGMGALRGAGQVAPSARLVSMDRTVQIGPVIPISTQTMCAPVIRQR